MTRLEFERSMATLKSVFGGSRYPPEKCDLMYEAFCMIGPNDFHRAVKKLILECQNAPSYAEFREALRENIQEAREAELAKKTENEPDCLACKNTGVVFAKNIAEPEYMASYAFQCSSCVRGEIFFPVYPKLEGTYKPVTDLDFEMSQEDEIKIKMFKEFSSNMGKYLIKIDEPKKHFFKKAKAPR